MNYYYCYSIQKGLFDDEMAYAKDLGVYIYYDEKEDNFFDQEGNLFDITNKNIFPRTGVYESKILVDAIIKHQGIPLVTNEDYDKTLNWPYYIKTERNNIILLGIQILKNPQTLIKVFGNDKIFFKTKEKNYSSIIEISSFFDEKSAYYKTLKEHQEEDFILSDVVSIDEDENGLLEYRVFVINNKIINISRVSDYLLETIPEDILEKANELINILKEKDFAKSYVLDLFIYTEKGKRVVDILECNPIIASGIYLYNSVFEKQFDLTHQCPSASIPKEKLKYGQSEYYGFSVKERRRPSICYNLPGGFSADLTSFTLFGEKSSKGMYFQFSTSDFNLSELPSLTDSKIDSTDEEMSYQEEKKKILKKQEK